MNAIVKRVKVLVGYKAHARWNAGLGEAIVGYIPRQPQIPTTYCYSPSHTVWDYGGTPVIICETAHRRYEVFEVNRNAIQPNEDAILAAIKG